MSKDDNEIMEIVYIRKVEGIPGANVQNTLKAAKTWEEEAAQTKQFCRQFLVRKCKSLEILYTNGINYWKVPIENSEV